MIDFEIVVRRYAGKWTSRIICPQNNEIVWSSGSQRYARRTDAVAPAEKFLRSARAGRVAIKVEQPTR